MKVLRTPDSCFKDLKEYPYKPVYTDIKTADGTLLRIHHIDGAKGWANIACDAWATSMELFVHTNDTFSNKRWY